MRIHQQLLVIFAILRIVFVLTLNYSCTSLVYLVIWCAVTKCFWCQTGNCRQTLKKKSEKLHNIFIWKCGRFQFRRLQFAFEFCQTHPHNIKRNHLQIEIFDTAVEHTVIFSNQKLKAKKKHLDRMFKNTLLTLFDFRENGNFTITSFSICVFVFCVCEFEMFVFMSLTFFVLLTKYLYYIDNENEFLFSDFFPLTFYSTIQTNDTENFQLFVSLYNWMANKIWMESRRTNEKQCR